MLLDRNALLKKEDLKIEKIVLGSNHIYVRQMTGAEREIYDDLIVRDRLDNSGNLIPNSRVKNARGKLAVCTICNKSGDLMLKHEDAQQISENLTSATLDKVVDVAMRLNGMDVQLKEMLAKNSEAAQSGVSTSDSVKS